MPSSPTGRELRKRAPRTEHTDLREAFVVEARKLVLAEGEAAVTIRRLSEALRVSPSAYLNHLRSLDELLGLVALRGFEGLLDAMRSGVQGIETRAQPLALAERYARFGVENGRLYRLMFSSRFAVRLDEAERRGFADLPPTSAVTQRREEAFAARQDQLFDDLAGVKAKAWGVIVAALQRAGARQEELRAAGLAYAALLHGLVGEFVDEGLFLAPGGDRLHTYTEERGEIVRTSVELLLRGVTARAH